MILKNRAKVRITYFNIYVFVNTKEIITDDKNATISSQLTNLNDENIDILSVLNIIILLDIAKIEYFNIENQHNRNSTRLNLIFYYVKYTKLVFLQFFLKWTLSYLFSRKHFVQINIDISKFYILSTSFGVLQESIIGHVLINLYSDILNILSLPLNACSIKMIPQCKLIEDQKISK